MEKKDELKVEKILKGYGIEPGHKITYVKLLEDSNNIDNNESKLEIEISGKRERLDTFFQVLEERLKRGLYCFVNKGENFFTIRIEEVDGVMIEEKFKFSESFLHNQQALERLKQYLEFVLEKDPNYEEREKNFVFARKIAGVLYNNHTLAYDNMELLGETKEFYLEHRDEIKEYVYKHYNSKKSKWLDFLINILSLSIINILFLSNRSFGTKLTVDIICATVLTIISEILFKQGLIKMMDKRLDSSIEYRRDWILNTYDFYCEDFNKDIGDIINKVVKAIKRDILVIEGMKYEGYEKDLTTIYKIGDEINYIIIHNTELGEVAVIDRIRDLLERLVDIEFCFMTKNSYFDTLNASTLIARLDDYEGLGGVKKLEKSRK